MFVYDNYLDRPRDIQGKLFGLYQVDAILCARLNQMKMMESFLQNHFLHRWNHRFSDPGQNKARHLLVWDKNQIRIVYLHYLFEIS